MLGDEDHTFCFITLPTSPLIASWPSQQGKGTRGFLKGVRLQPLLALGASFWVWLMFKVDFGGGTILGSFSKNNKKASPFKVVAFCFFHQAWALYPASFLLPWSGRTPTTPCWLSHLGSPNFVYGKHSHIHFPNKHRLAGPSQFCQQLALLYLLSLPARSQSEVHCQHYLSQAGVRHQIF